MKFLVKMFCSDIDAETWINGNIPKYYIYQISLHNNRILVVMKTEG